jgi:hypothetical protein
MYCPKCEDEFREGFTRCAGCNVDLVERLDEAPTRSTAPPPPTGLAEYCGFMSLDEARAARERLRDRQLPSDILVREQPDVPQDEPIREEYWLRIEPRRVREVAAALGDLPQAAKSDDEAGFACGDCGHHVAGQESFCPDCGARFDD